MIGCGVGGLSCVAPPDVPAATFPPVPFPAVSNIEPPFGLAIGLGLAMGLPTKDTAA